MRGPQAYYADDLRFVANTRVKLPDHETCVAGRPLCATWHETISNRLRLAWEVFTGKSDVLRWHGQ